MNECWYRVFSNDVSQSGYSTTPCSGAVMDSPVILSTPVVAIISAKVTLLRPFRVLLQSEGKNNFLLCATERKSWNILIPAFACRFIIRNQFVQILTEY